jgi:hypothetical protein
MDKFSGAKQAIGFYLTVSIGQVDYRLLHGCVLSMGNAMKTLAQHLHRCALDRLGCVSISGVRTSLCIGLANPLRSSCNARHATFHNTAMGLIAISFSTYLVIQFT